MALPSSELRILSKLSKQELIEKIVFLYKKQNNQTLKIKEIERALIKRNELIKLFKSRIEELKEGRKKKNILKQYENLLRDYRLEISDLKDEIENWKIRYINK